jgi:hypothetical protein
MVKKVMDLIIRRKRMIRIEKQIESIARGMGVSLITLKKLINEW